MKGGLGMVTKGTDAYTCIKCKQNVQVPYKHSISPTRFGSSCDHPYEGALQMLQKFVSQCTDVKY
jgi:hypothetical protein